MKTMQAGEFKAKCLAVMDEVLATGEPVLVTKRGKPVVRLVAPELGGPDRTGTPESIFGSLRGMATLVGDPDEWLDPVVAPEDWQHLKADWDLARGE